MTRPLLILWFAALPAFALAHGDLSWPAQYANANGTPCCTVDDGTTHGDCAAVPASIGASLGLGSVITLDFPSGRSETRINAIYESPEPGYWACKPGCLFTHTGV